MQLPIPPAGPGAIEGNVPLAAAYLKLFARRQGLEESYADRIVAGRAGQHVGRSSADRGDPCAAALDGRLHLLSVERRTYALDCRAVEAAAAGVDRAAGRPGNHRRQRLGAPESGGRLRGLGRGRADVRPIARGTLKGGQECLPHDPSSTGRVAECWVGSCTAIPWRVRQYNCRTNECPSPDPSPKR